MSSSRGAVYPSAAWRGTGYRTSLPHSDRARLDPSTLVRDGWQRLAGDRVGHRVLERARLPPLAGRPHLAGRADLVDAPVDLQIVAVGIAELDGDLAARPAPPLEHDRDAALAQPSAGVEHLG